MQRHYKKRVPAARSPGGFTCRDLGRASRLSTSHRPVLTSCNLDRLKFLKHLAEIFSPPLNCEPRQPPVFNHTRAVGTSGCRTLLSSLSNKTTSTPPRALGQRFAPEPPRRTFIFFSVLLRSEASVDTVRKQKKKRSGSSR